MSPLLEVILAEVRADPEAGRELVAELVRLAPDLVHGQARIELLTVHQAAEHASVSEKTIRRKISNGELEAVRIGNSVRVRLAELERFLGGPTREPASSPRRRCRGPVPTRSAVAAAFRALDTADPGQVRMRP